VLLDHVAAGRPFPAMGLAIAGWIRFMTGADERGAPIEGIKDPRASELRARATAVVKSPTAATVRPFLTEFFGAEVAESAAAVNTITAALAAVVSKGASASLVSVAAQPRAML
jgi:fructuronate reductase